MIHELRYQVPTYTYIQRRDYKLCIHNIRLIFMVDTLAKPPVYLVGVFFLELRAIRVATLHANLILCMFHLNYGVNRSSI